MAPSPSNSGCRRGFVGIAGLLVLAGAVLMALVCGGGGVLLQQRYHVVERPLEFAASDGGGVQPLPDPDPVIEVPKPRPVRRIRVPRSSSQAPVPISSDDPSMPKAPRLAVVTVSGDATWVRVVGAGTKQELPGEVPMGTYDVEVKFGEAASFVATTLLVIDETPKQVVCRSSLGICRVR